MEACTLKIFDITKLALSDYKENKEKLSGVSVFFDCLFSFLNKKTLVNTKMSCSDGLDVYCYDFKKVDDDYVVALWLAVGDAAGIGVSSLGKTSVVGSRAKKKKFGKDQIPGVPAYFYVSTKQNKIVTLEFKGSSGDSSLLTQYVKDFMHNFSKYAVHTYDKSVKKSSGFKVKKSDTNFCYFSFETKRFINASVEKDLILNHKIITHIITKSDIEVKSDTDSSIIDIMPILKLFSDKEDKTTIKSSVKIHSPVSFASEEEISEYISKIKGSYDVNKVGFIINSPSYKATLYLANSQAKEKVTLNEDVKTVKEIPIWSYTATDIASSLESENIIDDFIKASSVHHKIVSKEDVIVETEAKVVS